MIENPAIEPILHTTLPQDKTTFSMWWYIVIILAVLSIGLFTMYEMQKSKTPITTYVKEGNIPVSTSPKVNNIEVPTSQVPKESANLLKTNSNTSTFVTEKSDSYIREVVTIEKILESGKSLVVKTKSQSTIAVLVSASTVSYIPGPVETDENGNPKVNMIPDKSFVKSLRPGNEVSIVYWSKNFHISEPIELLEIVKLD